MARRSRKLITMRKPKLRVTSKGIKVTKPSYRIGGRKSGINISSKGVSYSTRTPFGTYNSRRGWSLGCALPILLFLMLFATFSMYLKNFTVKAA